MSQAITRFASALVGDHRRHPLEGRLFNAVSLLNGVTNLAGALYLSASRDAISLGLHVATGAFFLVCYCLSRFRGTHRPLYWPFVLVTLAFVVADSLDNAGTGGGAHYSLIPAALIAVILARTPRRTAVALALCGGATAAVLLTEWVRPGWVTPHAGPGERLADVSGNLLFVQGFTAALVLVLARTLDQERGKADRLLRNVLPEAIALELQRTDRVAPREYASASVLFTDFVGFTGIAERLTPQQLVAELDECFRLFDQVAREHRLEKIKTIGDSFMAAGGLPNANRTHAVDCVLAALRMRCLMAGRGAGRPGWRVRIGVHSGAVVAGVVGREKFAYDVWGDTVNTASRLESSGEPDRVNVSRATYEQVKDFFECEYRGRVPAKNKGEMEMYFVERLRPDLSEGGAGAEPNERFRELYSRRAQEADVAASRGRIADPVT